MERKDKPPGLLIKMLAGFLLFGAWFVILFPWIRYQFWQSDTFWLIETGRLILEKHCLPGHDPYSYTTTGHVWILYQWLTEVLFGLAYVLNGMAGVALFGAVVMAVLLFVLIYRHMLSRGTNPVIGVIAVALSAYAYCPDFSSLRPQLISFMLFWLLAVLCSDAKAGLPLAKATIRTFIIAVVWANCHISFPIGILLLVINFGASLLGHLRKRSDNKTSILFGSMLGTFLLGTIFTPYGLWLWAFIGNTHNLFYSQEVQPLIWTDQPFLMTFAFITLASCLYLRKKLDLADILVLLMLLGIGSNCTRLIVYFCIFSCPFIGEAASQLLKAGKGKSNDKSKEKGKGEGEDAPSRLTAALKSVAFSRLYIPCVLLLTTFIVMGQATRIPRNIPLQAASFLSRHPIKGNLFCSAHAGSYLIYSSRGAIPVFMDTRIDLYDAAFCKTFEDALYFGKNWNELFAQYKIAAALVPNNTELCIILYKHPAWKAIYRDHDFSIYVPKGTEPLEPQQQQKPQ